MIDFFKLVFLPVELVVASFIIGWIMLKILDRIEGIRRDHKDYPRR